MSSSHYTLDALLGSGAFGKVYRARYTGQDGFEKIVAIKVLHSDRVDAGEVARLRDEARLLGLLHHRAIVQVHELFDTDDGWAVVMELVGGVDLSRVVKAGPMPPHAALEAVAEIAGALDAAVSTLHEGRPLRLVHRDIKPANLRLTAAGEIKVLDFGIAHADFVAREARTETDKVLGTLRYMAPERFEGEDLPAGDVYALGIVLVELLGARMGKMGMLGAERHEQRVERTLVGIEHDVGRGVADLVRAMLAVDPTKRPTASQVAVHARRLAPTLEGLGLAEWSAAHVPALARASAEDTTADQRVGARMTSGTQTRASRTGSTETLGLLATLGVVGSLTVIALGVAALALVAAGVAMWRDVEPPRWDLTLDRVDANELDATWARPLSDGRHVVIANDDGCFRTTLDGSNQVDLRASGMCANPVPSPDGAQVAYWSGGDLHLWTQGGSKLLRDHAVPLAFSPDGRRLAYLATDAPDRYGRTSKAWLHVLELADDKDRRLLEDPAIRSAIWSPSGDRLLAWRADRHWYSVPLSGSPAEASHPGTPWAYTADGGLLGISGSPDQPELVAWAVDRQGLPWSEPQVLSAFTHPIAVGADPTGEHLLAQVSRTTWNHDRWTLRGARLSKPEPLRLPPGWDKAFPVGERFLLTGTTAEPGRPGEQRAALDRVAVWDGRGTPRTLTEDRNGNTTVVQVSRDGSTAWLHRQDPAAILVVDLSRKTPIPKPVVDLAGLVLRDLRISPDGTTLALATEARDLVLADAAKPIGPQLETPAPNLRDWLPVDWLPGGDQLVAVDSAHRVALITPGEESPEIVASDAVYATAVNDRTLLLHRPDRTDRLDLRTGRETPLFERRVQVHRIDDDHILVREAQEAIDRYLVRVDQSTPE